MATASQAMLIHMTGKEDPSIDECLETNPEALILMPYAVGLETEIVGDMGDWDVFSIESEDGGKGYEHIQSLISGGELRVDLEPIAVARTAGAIHGVHVNFLRLETADGDLILRGLMFVYGGSEGSSAETAFLAPYALLEI